MVRNPPVNAGDTRDMGLIPGLGRPPGVGNGNPLQYFTWEISLRIDWFDLLAVQGTFRSLLQHHGLEASILWRSATFMVQLSILYLTTGKTIALTV